MKTTIQPLDSSWGDALHRLSENMQVNNNAQAFVMRRQPDFFRLMRYQGQQGIVLGATQGQKLLGAMTLNFDRVFFDGKPRACVYTADLKVSSGARGKGLGDQLMQAAIKQSLSQDPNMLILTSVACDNAAGLRKNEKLRPLVHMQIATRIGTVFYPCISLGATPVVSAVEVKVFGANEVSNALKKSMQALWQAQSQRIQGARDYEGAFFEDPRCPPAQYWLCLFHKQKLMGFMGLWDQRNSRKIILPNQPKLLKHWLYNGDEEGALALLCGVHLCVVPSARRYLPLLLRAALRQGQKSQKRLFGLALDTRDPLHCFLPRWPRQQNELLLLSSHLPQRHYPFRPELALG